MKVSFSKYHGTGNDFILIDNRQYGLDLTRQPRIVAHLCDRHFGIGADGLILLEKDEDDIKMVYFNADGHLGSMCGNGARCFMQFAVSLGLTERSLSFMAYDGEHDAVLIHNGWVSVSMHDVEVGSILRQGEAFIIDTGSPHYVLFVPDLNPVNVFEEGRRIRSQPEFADDGINVNFVTEIQDGIQLRTYERGVEDVTLSCGTGVTAAALCHGLENNLVDASIRVKTDGGDLEVRFRKMHDRFTDIRLEGPAEGVFTGEVELEFKG